MANSPTRSRSVLVLALLLAALIVGVTVPAAAARPYSELPMQVMKEGLTAEEHVRRQIELSVRLARELPTEALEKAVRVPLGAREIARIDASSGSPLRIGLVKALRPVIGVGGLAAGDGLVYQTPNGELASALVVRAEGAGAIRLHVHDMWLPASAKLYVYSRNGQAYGPFTGAGPNGTGDFWTTAVFGSEAIVELRLSGPTAEADLRDLSFKITEAGLITAKFARYLLDSVRPPQQAFQKAFCGNEDCIVDATCVSGTPADVAKLAVAKMEWIQGQFIFTCTGGLIADDNPSASNFFLTANHCISQRSAAQNVTLYWRFASATCNSTSCPSNTGWPFVTSGSTISATNKRGDFTLLHLNGNPPAGSVFLGWTTAPVANTNGADLFRISNPGFGPQVYSQHDVDTTAPTCQGWPRGAFIYSRDIVGAIDGGSSGSPVVNASSQIVGQLTGTCGFSPAEVCESGPGEDNATVDGAFAFYFSRVQKFLDP